MYNHHRLAVLYITKDKKETYQKLCQTLSPERPEEEVLVSFSTLPNSSSRQFSGATHDVLGF